MSAGNEVRPAIPEAIKRAVRQRCGFGCVMCGTPIFHYDHMQPYAIVKEHRPNNLTLLCPNHHQSKTSGTLPDVVVANANAKPFNVGKDYTSINSLPAFGNTAEILLGSLLFTFDFEKYPDREGFAALAINGIALVGAQYENGNLLLIMYGADKSGKDLFVIERGELIVGLAALDFTREGNRFIVRERSTGLVVLDFLKADNGFAVNVGLVCHEGRGFSIDAGGVTILPQQMRVEGIGFKDCYCGISIGDPKVGQMTIP